MFVALYALRRRIAGCLFLVAAVHLSGSLALVQAEENVAVGSSIQAVSLDLNHNLDGTQLAHHGGEGAEAGALGGIAGAQVLGAATIVDARTQTYSDSLWGNLLLSMAYQRDPELQKLVKKMGRVNTVTLLSVAGVAGLGLAQSIYSYRQIEPQTIDVTEAHHAGGHDHIHMEGDSKVPSTLGIISSGATLGIFGFRAIAGKYYMRKMTARQVQLKTGVDSVLSRLESGVRPTVVWPDLSRLVGDRAGNEFLQLWSTVHPTVSNNTVSDSAE